MHYKMSWQERMLMAEAKAPATSAARLLVLATSENIFVRMTAHERLPEHLQIVANL